MEIVEIDSAVLPPGKKQAAAWCERLEAGDVLFFPKTPVVLHAEDLQFLLGLQQTSSSFHKNIAYKPKQDVISGVDVKTADAATLRRLQSVLRTYSGQVEAFLGGFLTPYERRWKLDYASFRPQEEQNRDLPLRRRNDLLHTDAFPTRPTHGSRILRFFNNIHPSRTRDWVIGEPFRTLVPQFAPTQIALPKPETGAKKLWKGAAQRVGLTSAMPALKRPPYDEFMMRFHNFLKENESYQQNAFKYPAQFPSGSSWMVYTDTVPHAVLAGQYALEQTFLVDKDAMIAPGHAPITVLEQMAGARLT